jgi:hypothetical protein
VLLGLNAFHIDLKLFSLLGADSKVKILDIGVGKVLRQWLNPCVVCCPAFSLAPTVRSRF